MMHIVILSLLFIIVWSSKRKIDVIVVFNAMWLLIVILHKINLCGLYPIEARTYWIVILGVLSFDIGYFIHSRYNYRGAYYASNSDRRINEPILFVVLVIHTILNTFFALRMIPYILGGSSLDQIRAIFQGYNEDARFYTGNGMHRIWAYISSPWMTVLSCIVVYTLISRKRLRKSFYILFSIDIVMYFIYTASRTTVFSIMVMAFVYFMIYRNEINPRLRRKIYFFIAGVFCIVLFLTSLSFGNRKVEIYKAYRGLGSIYVYAVGPISLLDIFIKNADSMNIHTFGAILASPIIRLFNAGKVAIGINKSDLQLSIEELNNYKETL